jgi:hypothetical protein
MHTIDALSVDAERNDKLKKAKLENGFYNIIDGQKVSASKRLSVINPATGKPPAADTANGDGLSPAQGHRNYSRRSRAGSTQANLERLADDYLSLANGRKWVFRVVNRGRIGGRRAKLRP